MKKAIILDRQDHKLLSDILEYFIHIDTRERDDFIACHDDLAMNEYGVLNHDLAKSALQTNTFGKKSI